MFRITSVLTLGLVTLGAAYGGAFTTVGSYITTDLTQAQVGTCTTASCTPTNFASTGTYMNQVFTNTSNNVPTPGATAQTVNTGTPFVINAQTSNGKDTLYGAQVPETVVVDLGTCTGVVANLATCGIFNIANIYTMIQANVESFGYQGVTVTLNGTSANGSTAITDTINLTAGVDYRGSSNLSTTNPNAVTCTDANGGTTTGCTGSIADTAVASGTDNNPGGTAGNKVVTSNNVFGAITNATPTNFYLDVQELELPTSGVNSFVGGYLNSVTITSASGERLLFSGLTLQTAAPEPSTWLLFAAGIGLLAFLKIRGSRTTA